MLRAANTLYVGTSTRGFISNAGIGPRGSTNSIFSPIPRTRAGIDNRHIGTSAPNPRIDLASGINSLSSAVTKYSWSLSVRRTRKIAAASDDPPPIPDAAGRFFVKVIAYFFSADIPRTAFSIRLSISVGTPATSGPSRVRDKAFSLSKTNNSSPASANATRLSSR